MVFAVMGGDLRQIKLAEALCRDGHEVRGFALGQLSPDSPVTRTGSAHDAVRGANAVLMPLPAEKNGLLFTPLDEKAHDIKGVIKEIVGAGSPPVFAGRVSAPLSRYAKEAGVQVFDYFEREELQVMNAAATAEGAVMTALESTGSTLLGSNCLVVGFGRIGRLLAPRLAAMGARVTVSARRAADKAWIRAYGWSAADTQNLEVELQSSDVVFNTVPARAFTLPRNTHAVYIELASEPGGADVEKLQCAGFEYVPAPGLPGRVAPESSGGYIRDTIYNMLCEMGVDINVRH